MGKIERFGHVTFERFTYGSYVVELDGEQVGRVVHIPGRGWIATPVMEEPSERHSESIRREAHRVTRTDATLWMLDWSGLPYSVATVAMSRRRTLTADQQVHLDRTVKELADV